MNILIFLVMTVCLVCLSLILIVKGSEKIFYSFFWTKKDTFGPSEIPVFLNCSKERYKEVSSLVAELPEKMCYILKEKGYQVNMLNHNEYVIQTDEFDWIVGLFAPTLNTIFIDVDRPIDEIRSTLYHEFGHFCDWLDGNCVSYSSDNEFVIQQIYQGYKNDTNIPEYYRSDAREFVAYCVSNVVCNPSIITSQMQAIGRMFIEHAFMAADDARNH